MLTEHHSWKYKSLMYASRAIYNNNPKLPADNCVIKPLTCGYSSFLLIFKIYVYWHNNSFITKMLTEHHSWKYKSLMYVLRTIHNNNPKLPEENCVIKPQTCVYSSFYQFSRYTYIDTTILSSHKCLQSTTVGNISH